MRLFLIPRFAEILVLPARPAVQALRCRALTTGERVRAVRRKRKRSVSLQKPLNDLPCWAERYPSASLCQVFDPVKASLTDAVNEAAMPLVSPPARPSSSSVASPPRPRRPSPAAALRLPPLLQQCVVRRLIIVVLLL